MELAPDLNAKQLDRLQKLVRLRHMHYPDEARQVVPWPTADVIRAIPNGKHLADDIDEYVRPVEDEYDADIVSRFFEVHSPSGICAWSDGEGKAYSAEGLLSLMGFMNSAFSPASEFISH